MTAVPPALRDLLRTQPDDPTTFAIFTDWLEENGYAVEATWLLDQRADMAALFRPQTEDVDPFPGIDTRWLGLRNGMVTSLTVPQHHASSALATVQLLARSPLAIPLNRVHALHGRDAVVWLPLVRRHLPQVTAMRLGADVDPRLLDGLTALRTLDLTAVAASTPGAVELPALTMLSIDVRGRRLDLLDAISPPSVDLLVLEAPSWDDVPTSPLERFLDRVSVHDLDVMGDGAQLIRAVFEDR